MVTRQDEFLLGRGMDVSIGRTYNSLGDKSDDNGDNWRQSTQRSVIASATLGYGSANSTVQRVSGDGSVVTYTWLVDAVHAPNGAYVATDSAGAYDVLTRASGVWTWVDGDSQVTEIYGTTTAAAPNTYLLDEAKDADGNALTYGYNASGRLESISTENGESVTYSWTGDHITGITSNGVIRTHYGYETIGTKTRLTSVTIDRSAAAGDTYVTTYGYNSAGRLELITQSDGSSLKVDYTGDKVATLTETVVAAVGTVPAVTRITTIAYDGSRTTITDPSGVKTDLVCDAKGQLTGITLPQAGDGVARQTIAFGYNSSGDLTSVTDMLGRETSYDYTSGWGKWTKRDMLAITDGSQVVTRQYDADNNLLSESRAIADDTTVISAGTATELAWVNAATRYAYDANDHLVYTVNQAGEVTEYRYFTTVGKTDLVQYRIVYTANMKSGAVTKDSMNTWRDDQDAKAAQVTEYAYDGRGMLVSEKAYGRALANGTPDLTDPSVSETTYVYDQYGRLLSRGVTGDNPTSYAYDGLDRLVLMSDPAGNTTSIVFNDAASTTVVTLSTGLVETSTYNLAGELVAKTSTPGSTTINSRPDLFDAGQWEVANLNKADADLINGERAFRYSVATGGVADSLRSTSQAVAAGDTITFEITLRGDSVPVTSLLALTGSSSGWGDGSNTTAQILSGPGTLTASGGRWQVTGLSATGETHIRVTRTFTAAEQVRAAVYIDSVSTSTTVGHAVIVSAPSVTRENPNDVMANLASDQAGWALTNVAAAANNKIIGGKQYTVSAGGASGSARTQTATAAVGDSVTLELSLLGIGMMRTATLGVLAGSSFGAAADSQSVIVAGPGTLTHLSTGEWRVTGLSNATETRIRIVRKITVAGTARGQVTVGTGGTSTAAGDAIIVGLTSLMRANAAALASGGITATTKYDKLGRVRVASDASGNTHYLLYDGAGRKTADVGHDGSVVEYLYDNGNRVVATIAYAVRLLPAVLTQLGDPNTKLAIAGIRPSASGAEWTWSVYDGLDRVVQTIAGDGSTALYDYDPAGHLLRTTAFANKLDTTTFTQQLPTQVVLPTADSARDAVTRNFYDAAGRLIGTLDALGYFVRNFYDDAGQLTATTAYAQSVIGDAPPKLFQSAALNASFQSVRNALTTGASDRTTRTIYDGRGLLRYVRDALGHVTEYVYDAAGRVTTQIAYAAIPVPTSYSYADMKTALADPAFATDPANRVTSSVYDDGGRLIFTVSAESAVTQFFYDYSGVVSKTIAYVNPKGAEVTVNQNAMNSWASNLAQQTAGGNRITRSYHNAQGQLVFVVDAEGYVTRSEYDAAGRMTRTYRFDTSLAVSDIDTIATIAARLRGTPFRDSRSIYDGLGRVIATVDALGVRTRLTYLATGELAVRVVAFGTVDAVRTTYTYDAAGRLESETNAPESIAATTTYTYDGLGNVTTVTDPDGYGTRFFYDALGRQTYTLDPLNAVTKTVYDAFGGVVTLTRYAAPATGLETLKPTVASNTALDQVSRRSFDNLGRVDRTLDAQRFLVETDYDAFGAVSAITSFALAVTDLRTELKDVTVVSDPARDQTRYRYYDKVGRLVMTSDAEGYVVKTDYTIFGEVDQVTRWGAAGKNGSATTRPTYTVPSTGQTQDAITKFLYDKLGRVTNVTDAENFTEHYDLNAFGDRISVKNKLGGITTNVFDRRGLLIQETLPVKALKGTAFVDLKNTFEYDARGNRTKMIEALGLTEQRTTAYAYDKLDRLVAKTGDDLAVMNPTDMSTSTKVAPTERYSYDRRGNLILVTDVLLWKTFSYYDAAGRKTDTISPVGTLTHWTYNALGNVETVQVYASPVDPLPLTPGGTPPVGSGAERKTGFEYYRNNRLKTTTIYDVNVGAIVNGNWVLTNKTSISTTINYDFAGNIIEQIDANKNSIHTFYDRNNRKTAQVDQANYLTKWTLDADGNVLTETRYAKPVAAWDTWQTLSETSLKSTDVNNLDRITKFTYYLSGLRKTETRVNVEIGVVSGKTVTPQKADATISYTYNGLGEVLSKTEATDTPENDEVTRYEYDLAGRQTKITRPSFTATSGASTLDTTYDGLGNVTKTVQNGTRTTTYAYGAGGRLASMTDPMLFKTEYFYDAAGRVVATKYKRSQSNGTVLTEGTSVTYDAAGRTISQRTVAWDAANAKWNPVGAVTDMFYNSFGEVTEKGTNSGGVRAQAQEFAEYDNAGRIWRTNFNDGVTKAYGYDANGNATLLLQTIGTVDLRDLATLKDLLIGDTSGFTKTISLYDARNQLTDTIQAKSYNTGADPIKIVRETESGSAGVQYFDGNVGVEDKNRFDNLIKSGTVASTSVATVSKAGVAKFWMTQTSAQYSDRSIDVQIDSYPGAAEGNFHLVRRVGSEEIELDSNTYAHLEATIGYSGSADLYVYHDIGETGARVLVAHATLTNAPVSSGQTLPPGAQVTVNPAVQIQNVQPGATVLRMLVRTQGSSEPYSVIELPRLLSAGGATVAGWFAFDATQSPFNGLAANSSWDIQYQALDSAGKIYDAKKGTLSVDGSGVPSVDVDPMPVNGPGQVTAVWDGTYYTLLFSGLPINTQTLKVFYRTVGSTGAFSALAVNPSARGGAYGQAGWWTGRPPTTGGPYEFWIEPRDASGALIGGRSTGTFVAGGDATALMQYSARPEVVTFNPPAGQGVTLQQFRYKTGTTWSAWIQKSGSATWPYDATALAPDFYSSYSYPIEYETYAGTTLVSRERGTLRLGYSGQGLDGRQDDQGVPAKVLITPSQENVARITLYWRVETTGVFNPVEIPIANGEGYWDIEAAGIRPAPGADPRTVRFYYDAYDAGGKLLLSGSGTDHVEGTISLSSNRYTAIAENEVRWVINLNAPDTAPYLIHREQTYNAFGEISSETDGRDNTTRLFYNTEGKLIRKEGPTVNVTNEDKSVVPTVLKDYYYFDKSGRQIAHKDANDHVVTQELAGGSGYDGAEAIVVKETRFDGTTQYGLDAFGNVTSITDALGNVTQNEYDAADRLITVTHPTRGTESNTQGVNLIDHYTYDQLGQRLSHWNSFLSGVKETTDYDATGRVTSTKSFAGQTTLYKYTYYEGTGPKNAALDEFDGWRIDVASDGETDASLTDEKHYRKVDILGHLTKNVDMSGLVTAYSYNEAGQLTHQASLGTNPHGSSAQNIDYTYYTNGYIASVTDNTLKMKSTFEYDNDGNRTLETYNSTDSSPVFYQNAVISYDAANRVTHFLDAKADIIYQYDAVGNRREVNSVYYDAVTGSRVRQDYWYSYDESNRFLVTMGEVINGEVKAGRTGIKISYDNVGNRTQAIYGTNYGPGGHTETYTYSADGYLEQTTIVGSGSATRINDAMGRVTTYQEYQNGVADPVTTRVTEYDNDNRIKTETTDARVKDGTGYDTVHTVQKYDYKKLVGTTYTGVDQGVVSHMRSTQTDATNGSTITTDTAFSYDWWDEAKQSRIEITGTNPSNQSSYKWAPGYSRLGYDVNGHLTSMTDETAAVGPRVLNYENDAYGQVLVREERDGAALGPRQLYYYFNGHRIGDVGNNGVDPSRLDYAQTLARSGAGISDPKGGFRAGHAVSSADFDANYQPINAGYPGGAAGGVTVQTGDTLSSIAQTVWGDAALWYLIADANGVTNDTALVAGQRLIIPNKVTNFHNNSSTFRVYNPGEAIGDTLPTLPAKPAFPTPRGNQNKCGVFGQILLAVVAVAVSVALPGGGSVLGAALNGAIGSAVSQGVGLATGIQEKFSLGGVALSALSAGVFAGVGEAAGALGKISGTLGKVGRFLGGSGVGSLAARGVLSSGISQGIATATGLQARFDWAGVAAAGVGGGASGFVGGGSGFGERLARSAADGFAQASARSLITGTSFGDNIIAVLPNVIAQTIGGFVQDRIVGQRSVPTFSVDPAALDDDTVTYSNGAGSRLSVGGATMTGSAYAAGTSARVSAAQDGDVQDIIVIADRRTASLIQGMTAYQYGRYTANVGQRSYRPAAEWASQLSEPGGYDFSGYARSTGSPLLRTLTSLNGYGAGYSISAAPSKTIFSDYRNAVLGRQSIARELLQGGGLGYVAGPVEFALSAATGASDLFQSYYRGRDGVILPMDRQTTDIASIALGGAKTVLSSTARLGRAAETAGSGSWQAVNEAMSGRAAAYQTQIAGRSGQAYIVDGVKFDGFADGALLDAKGPGYGTFVKDGEFRSFFRGQDSLAAQAQRQLSVSNGAPITWHVAEPSAADAMRSLFQSRGIEGVRVVHTPVAP